MNPSQVIERSHRIAKQTRIIRNARNKLLKLGFTQEEGDYFLKMPNSTRSKTVNHGLRLVEKLREDKTVLWTMRTKFSDKKKSGVITVTFRVNPDVW